MKLSEKEKEIILQIRAEEESQKPIKIGYLKHDLYRYNMGISYFKIDKWLFSFKEKEELHKNFEDKFTLIPIGTELVCYLEDGVELWYDDDCLAGMDENWAKDNLENIKLIKRKVIKNGS